MSVRAVAPRRKQLESDRLLTDEILDPDGVEMAPAAEGVDGVVSQKEP